jgi:hypothetical protein
LSQIFSLSSCRPLRSRAQLTAALLFSTLAAFAAEPTFTGPLAAGTLEAPPKQEASGLAASHRTKDVLWTHDDSGGAPVLYAINTAGKKRGSVRVTGVKNEDWEDVASFVREGKPWLLVADTGDNDAKRDNVRIHVLEEPTPEQLKPGTDAVAAPSYSLRIRYEDGPRDCESVAVDPVEGAIYLLTKRNAPPRLYRAPLGASRETPVVARFMGQVPELAGTSPIDALFKHVAGKRAAWPTGFDISADGRIAVVLTYGAPVVFARMGKDTWAETFKREPARLLFHGLPQAEGVCFSADGRAIYVVSETTAAMVRYDRD